MRVVATAVVVACLVFAGCAESPPPTEEPVVRDRNGDDVVVVAVIDSGFNPYHFDFRASMMPQARNADPSDDLPLDKDPATWITGHPGASAFASYEAIQLTLSDDPEKLSADLHTADADAWSSMKQSSASAAHVRYFPGTKIVGALTFGSGDGFSPGSHGVGSSSVSVGNFHGSCPECLLVFVDGTNEAANRWVEAQDWIDFQTNSWGISKTGVLRDRIYAGSDTESQRAATERGQSLFFSAGNGLENGFVVTNPTLFSSQEGPDWIVTVGAILPNGGVTGAGKPADISAPGSEYPSAYGSTTLNGTGFFGGTSNATPVTTGLAAHTLYMVRRDMEGESRVQRNGTISVGGPGTCGPANPACALADGELSVYELQHALFRSARYTGTGYTVTALGLASQEIPESDNALELLFMGAGHGSYWGLLRGPDVYAEETQRILDYLRGQWYEEQDADQKAWFVADSICRQAGWGTWEHGLAQGETPPAASPAWPVRTWLVESCPTVLPAAIEANRMTES